MSWSRFLVIAVLTLLALAPLAPVLAPVVTALDEPLQPVVIVAVAVAVFYMIDRLVEWTLGSLRPRKRPDA